MTTRRSPSQSELLLAVPLLARTDFGAAELFSLALPAALAVNHGALRLPSVVHPTLGYRLLPCRPRLLQSSCQSNLRLVRLLFEAFEGFGSQHCQT